MYYVGEFMYYAGKMTYDIILAIIAFRNAKEYLCRSNEAYLVVQNAG